VLEGLLDLVGVAGIFNLEVGQFEESLLTFGTLSLQEVDKFVLGEVLNVIWHLGELCIKEKKDEVSLKRSCQAENPRGRINNQQSRV